MEHIISDAGRGVSHWEVEKVGRGHSEFDLSTRVDDDIARGDLGMAKRRLGASLGSRGYDAVTLGKLGRVCWEMRDPYEAGRHWLLSTETGPEVDSAIKVFLDRNGRKPEQIAS